MPASLLPAIPFLFAAGAGFLPSGAPLRHGAVGASLTALAVAAVSRAAGAPVSFHTINNTILWSGLMLGGVGVVEGWRRGHRATLLPLTIALALSLPGCAALLQEGRLIVSLFAGVAGAAALVALRLKVRRKGNSADRTILIWPGRDVSMSYCRGGRATKKVDCNASQVFMLQ